LSRPVNDKHNTVHTNVPYLEGIRIHRSIVRKLVFLSVVISLLTKDAESFVPDGCAIRLIDGQGAHGPRRQGNASQSSPFDSCAWVDRHPLRSY
jgi:hypothetical protein